jgi:hypothetical protein
MDSAKTTKSLYDLNIIILTMATLMYHQRTIDTVQPRAH